MMTRNRFQQLLAARDRVYLLQFLAQGRYARGFDLRFVHAAEIIVADHARWAAGLRRCIVRRGFGEIAQTALDAISEFAVGVPAGAVRRNRIVAQPDAVGELVETDAGGGGAVASIDFHPPASW